MSGKGEGGCLPPLGCAEPPEDISGSMDARRRA
jgi:hypothetical protein